MLLFGVVLVGLLDLDCPESRPALTLPWELGCLAVGLVGLALRVLTVGYAPGGASTRSTRAPRATALTTTGMYSLVRHPLYLGNYFLWLGVAVAPRVWWVPVLITLVFWLYYERIMVAEEAYLRHQFGETFVRWARRTPAVWPAVTHWRAPALPFSVRTALKREHSALFGLVAAISLVQVLEALQGQGHVGVDPVWSVLLESTTLLYVLLVVLKKRGVLDVAGR